MKLFSWIHGRHKKSRDAEGSALHSSCESYTSHLDDEKPSKGSSSRRQMQVFELCLPGDCSGLDDLFGDEFQTYQDGVSSFVSHEQFGLLAIGTFGFNSYEGKAELESLRVKQLAVRPDKSTVRPDNFMPSKGTQLEESPGDVFGVDQDKDGVEMPLSCIVTADHQNGSENSTTSWGCKFLARGALPDHEAIFLKKGKCGMVVGWPGGKKVHAFSNTESSAPDEAIVASHVKKKLRENLVRHCRMLGSCFGGNSHELARRESAPAHDSSVPRNKTLKANLSSEKCSSSVISTLHNSTQAQDPCKFTKTSRFTGGKKELESRKINQQACRKLTCPDDPELWPAVPEGCGHQKHVPISRHHFQSRAPERIPVTENWINTDSEYVVLECL